MIPININNDKLSWFAANQWNLKRAVNYSDSLKRAAKAINNFKPVFDYPG